MALRNWGGWLAAAGLAVLTARPAAAQSLTFSGSPASLHITTTVAGSVPTALANAATTYTTSTAFGSAKKILVQLSSNMPAGTTLTINMTAIPGSTSTRTLTLTPVAQTALNNVWLPFALTAAVTYTFSATSAAGVIPSLTRTVTFTMVPYP